METTRTTKKESADLESQKESGEGGGGEPTNLNNSIKNAEDMNVCPETDNPLTNEVGTTSQSLDQTSTENSSTPNTSPNHYVSSPVGGLEQQQVSPAKTVTKVLVSNHQTSVVTPVLPKLSNPPVITVLNSGGGPLTVLKTLCVTTGVSSAPQFSLVNNQSLTVTSAVGKSPTITLLNAPVTLLKVPPQTTQFLEKPSENASTGATQNVPTIIENRAHNVFVKNTCSDQTVPEVPQSHKFLTANSFPQTNVLANIPPGNSKTTVNGQRNKLKILSNVVVPAVAGTSYAQPPNVAPNKTNTQQQQRVIPRQKVLGPNGSQTKYVNKLQSVQKQTPAYNLKQVPDKALQHQSQQQQQQQPQQTRIMYPTHKSQIKTIPPVNNYTSKVHGLKSLSSQQQPQSNKSVPGQIQRTGSGLRTIPPQRPPKLPNKLNYIGKHAVQAQKVRQTGQNRFNKTNLKQSSAPAMYNNYNMPPVHANKQLAFNQALTAEILETLSNKSGPTTSYLSKSFEILPNKYESSVYTEQKLPEPAKFEDQSKSRLDALSLICQAVLLDHNYNATLPPDSPTRSTSLSNSSSQINGISPNSMLLYSPGGGNKSKYLPERKRTLSTSNPVSSSSIVSNVSSLMPSNVSSLMSLRVDSVDDDAASDISDCSDRKRDTEGEETDTAPEAEAVANDEPYDHYGDYVTRCICGFLHDDGYMVECDQCKVWQHVQCVVKNKQIPDEYLCEKCNPLKSFDPHKARLIQQQWLRERQQLPDLKNLKKESKLKESLKHKEILSDSDSSDAENPRHNNNITIPKGRTVTQRKKADKQLGKQKKEPKEPITQKRMIKKKERKFVRRKSKLQTKNAEDDNNDSFVATQLPQLRQWIENYEEAVTNHYSPELRARISNLRVNGAHTPETAVPFDPSISNCRVHTQPLTDLKYLVATVKVPPDTLVIELRGKYMLSTQHRNSGGNLTTRQHAQRPGPFLFFYRLHKDNTEVCVDTRTYGNSARFIRRSCKPNAELRHCIEKGVLHLYIVTIAEVDKNVELTIKHESHDLAAVGTTQIACYCGNPEECKINKTSLKKNGESSTEVHRKRRGRRAASAANTQAETESVTPVKMREEPPTPPPAPPPPQTSQQQQLTSTLEQTSPSSPEPVNVNTEPMTVEEIKEDIVNKELPEVKEASSDMLEINEEPIVVKMVVDRPSTPENVLSKDLSSPPETPEKNDKESRDDHHHNKTEFKKSAVSTRRSSQPKSVKERGDGKRPAQKQGRESKCRKLSREERKLEAILRAIEQMEKADLRKLEHKQTKQVQRRESEPSPHLREEDKTSEPKQRRKRRKGRARTTSTHSVIRDRLNSGDSYFTSGDENMLSPTELMHPKKHDDSNDESTSEKPQEGGGGGLLLAISSAGEDNERKREKSPIRENDSNSNSAHSSPETPLSLACSLVQAAVEPLESGFKFPKTKKGLMNEWLNKAPESSTTPSPLSPHVNTIEDSNTGFYTPTKTAQNVLVHNETGPKGSAKKRWLRQAISEDKTCDSPQGSPPLNDSVAPPKKRRLPRESISNDNTPPSTPTGPLPSGVQSDCATQQEGCVEIVYSGAECDDGPVDTLESDAVLEKRAAEMKQEFGKCTTGGPIDLQQQKQLRPDVGGVALTTSFGCLMDPRLRNHHHAMFANSEHLVGTVEKTLTMLGFEERRPEALTPAKRKLSITEYRQRKKLNNNDTNDKSEDASMLDDCMNEENNSSESFKQPTSRPRLNSTSSLSSISSDDETNLITELPAKTPAFNSEPTELERQREMQSLRLKKAFGLSIDAEPRKPALDVEAILNCELSPTLHTTVKSQILSDVNVCETSDCIKSTSSSPGQTSNIITSQPLSPILCSNDKARFVKIESPLQKAEIQTASVQSPIGQEKISAEEELRHELSPTMENMDTEQTDVMPDVMEIRDEEMEKPIDSSKMETAAANVEEMLLELGEGDGEGNVDEKELEMEPDVDVKFQMFYTPDEEEDDEDGEAEIEIDLKDFPKIESVSYVPPFNNPIYPGNNYTSLIDEEGLYEGRNPSPPPSHLDTTSTDGEN